MRRVLPNLDAVHVREPCTASWETMEGDERVRFCGVCAKHVHDLSALSRQEAAAVLATKESVCVRFARREDGSIHTRAAVVVATVLLTTAFGAGDSPAPMPTPAPATTPTATPAPRASATTTYTMGCVCAPGDALCSCL